MTTNSIQQTDLAEEIKNELRFWDKVAIGNSTECWIWQRGTHVFGYGCVKNEGKMTSAHRVSWKYANGEEIPAGLFVLHKCDNPPCVNPNHLYLGTPSDNMRDMMERGRENPPIGERNHFSRLTELEVAEIKTKHAKGGITPTELAREYGVSFQAISAILKGRTWKTI